MGTLAMGTLKSVAAAVGLTLLVAGPSSATVVRIETAATFADASEESVNVALHEAVESSIKGAAAMGLSTVWLDQAFVLDDRVVVRIFATDETTAEEDEDDAEPAVPDTMPSLIEPPRWLDRSPGISI
jgi:hypothetical protein